MAPFAHHLDRRMPKQAVDDRRARRDHEDRGVDPSVAQPRLGLVVGQGQQVRVLGRDPASREELQR